jgi:WD40 repeat protein
VAWSSDIKRLASSSSDATIRIWNPLTGECVQTITEHGDAVISVVWSRDAKRLVSASDDKTVKIWDAATGQCISTFEDFAGVTKVAWLSSHSRVVSVSRVGMSKVWEIETGQLLKTVEGYNFYLAWSFDMTKLLPESDDTIMASKTTSLSLADEGDLVSQHIGVNGDGTWITYKGKNLVALPSDYRPCAAAVHGNCLALGCASGRVLLLMFSDLDSVV